MQGWPSNAILISEYDRGLPKTLRAVFTKIIKPTLGERCKAQPSNIKYSKKFKEPVLLDNLINSYVLESIQLFPFCYAVKQN